MSLVIKYECSICDGVFRSKEEYTEHLSITSCKREDKENKLQLSKRRTCKHEKARRIDDFKCTATHYCPDCGKTWETFHRPHDYNDGWNKGD